MARLSIVPDSGSIGSDAAVTEHRAIIAAFEAADPVVAEAAVRAHIEAARRRMQRHAPLPHEAAAAPPAVTAAAAARRARRVS